MIFFFIFFRTKNGIFSREKKISYIKISLQSEKLEHLYSFGPHNKTNGGKFRSIRRNDRELNIVSSKEAHLDTNIEFFVLRHYEY